MTRFSYTGRMLGVSLFGLFSTCGMYPAFAAQAVLIPRTCPQIKNLVQDTTTQYWSAENKHWRSHTMSFANKIETFLGAQWVGSTVGTVYCLYKGTTVTFPIKLEFDSMTPNPSGNKWSQDLGHFKNCVSHNLNDCTFMAIKKEKSINLYEQLDNIKPKPSIETGF